MIRWKIIVFIISGISLLILVDKTNEIRQTIRTNKDIYEKSNNKELIEAQKDFNHKLQRIEKEIDVAVEFLIEAKLSDKEFSELLDKLIEDQDLRVKRVIESYAEKEKKFDFKEYEVPSELKTKNTMYSALSILCLAMMVISFFSLFNIAKP